MSEITVADLSGAMGTVPSYAVPNAKWLCSSVFNAVVFDRLKAAAGGSTIIDMEGKPRLQFLGYAVVLSSLCPTTTAAINNTPMCYFGDFRQAVSIGDRRGVTIKVDGSRYLEYDQLAVLGTTRWDLVVHDIGDATNAGPVVALMGNT